MPASALADLGKRGFSFYVHVPYCTVRCGYCDFNTYTADELGPGASRADLRSPGDRGGPPRAPGRWATWTCLSRPSSSAAERPTLLSPADLGSVARGDRRGVRARAGDAEVTTESNPTRWRPPTSRRCGRGVHPDLVRHAVGGRARAAGARPHPRPAAGAAASSTGRASAGFDQVSLDLIYGTPGESVADWAVSVDAALACAPDHVSAYSLIVEDGTALARQVRRGELPMPDDDDLADKYLLADERARRAPAWAGTRCRTGPATGGARCRHNLAYWRGGDWWGVGPGAHSHVGGTRWWNVKHPAAYADRLAAGRSPAQAREVLDEETRRVERVLLEVRLRDGLALERARRRGRAAVARRGRRAGSARSPGADGSCSRAGAGCSPTPSCATCCLRLAASVTRP